MFWLLSSSMKLIYLGLIAFIFITNQHASGTRKFRVEKQSNGNMWMSCECQKSCKISKAVVWTRVSCRIANNDNKSWAHASMCNCANIISFSRQTLYDELSKKESMWSKRWENVNKENALGAFQETPECACRADNAKSFPTARISFTFRVKEFSFSSFHHQLWQTYRPVVSRRASEEKKKNQC